MNTSNIWWYENSVVFPLSHPVGTYRASKLLVTLGFISCLKSVTFAWKPFSRCSLSGYWWACRVNMSHYLKGKRSASSRLQSESPTLWPISTSFRVQLMSERVCYQTSVNVLDVWGKKKKRKTVLVLGFPYLRYSGFWIFAVTNVARLLPFARIMSCLFKLIN